MLEPLNDKKLVVEKLVDAKLVLCAFELDHELAVDKNLHFDAHDGVL